MLRMTHEQHIYGWMIKQKTIEIYDLSWPCLALSFTETPKRHGLENDVFASSADLAAHREVTAIFKRMGVR